MSQTLQALAEFTAARLIGDGTIEIERVASIAHAQTGDLVFVESARHLEIAMKSRASAVIVKESDAEITTTKPLLINSSSAPGICHRGAIALSPEEICARHSSIGPHRQVGQSCAHRKRRCLRRH